MTGLSGGPRSSGRRDSLTEEKVHENQHTANGARAKGKTYSSTPVGEGTGKPNAGFGFCGRGVVYKTPGQISQGRPVEKTAISAGEGTGKPNSGSGFCGRHVVYKTRQQSVSNVANIDNDSGNAGSTESSLDTMLSAGIPRKNAEFILAAIKKHRQSG